VRDVQVLTSSARAVVFRKHYSPQHNPKSRAFACLRHSGPVRELRRSGFTRSRLKPQLAGRYVGFRQIFELNDVSGESSGVVVLDISTGTITVEQPGMPGTDYSTLVSFVVKSNGSVAWLGISDSDGEAVWKVDSTTGGQPERLDSSPPDIPFDSLHLGPHRHRVLWRKGGSRRSAPID
jgi:hypothetical protein